MYDFRDQGARLLKRAADVADLDPAAVDLLSVPMRLIHFRIPLRMDDGSRRVFDAYRARHNDALGPTRDGTRIAPDLDADEVSALSLLMTVKHAAGHIPAGGGKGGIAADPRALTRWEYERLCRGYIRHLQPTGPAIDVPGADIGTNLQTMGWMLDEYEQITGGHCPPAINDKPALLGGSLGGEEATGRGVFDVFAEAAEEAGLALDGATVAVQGFGQVGAVAASLFQQAGCRVVAVADSAGGIHSEAGLEIEAVRAHKRETGGVQGFPGAENVSGSWVLECPCDVLVPAAVQGVITTANAPRIRPRLLVEAANGPTTLEAEAILQANGVTVVPDVLANAGSVQVCQMERSQGLYDNYWDLESIDRLRHERLVAAYRDATHTAARHRTGSVRLGAWINALLRVQEAMTLRSWV